MTTFTVDYSMKPNIQTITSIILDEGYYAALPTIGPSMYPTIRSGDKIYIESLNSKMPEIGDIILFSSRSSPHSEEEVTMICHRLVKIFEKDGVIYYQTRGDAFFHKDRPITCNEIIGMVVKIEKVEVSLPRRILLLLYPITGRVTFFNAAIITVLVWIKQIIFKS